MADYFGSGYDPSSSTSSGYYDPSVYSYGGSSSSYVPDYSSYWTTPPSSLNTPVYAPSTPTSSVVYGNSPTESYGAPTTAQYYNAYLSGAGGSVPQAFQNINQARFVGNAPLANIPQAANAEHALFSGTAAQLMPAGTGYLGAAMAPPIYQGAKLAAQTLPAPVGNLMDWGLQKLWGPSYSFVNATPPSWEQLLWGMKPLWPAPTQFLRR